MHALQRDVQGGRRTGEEACKHGFAATEAATRLAPNCILSYNTSQVPLATCAFRTCPRTSRTQYPLLPLLSPMTHMSLSRSRCPGPATHIMAWQHPPGPPCPFPLPALIPYTHPVTRQGSGQPSLAPARSPSPWLTRSAWSLFLRMYRNTASIMAGKASTTRYTIRMVCHAYLRAGGQTQQQARRYDMGNVHMFQKRWGSLHHQVHVQDGMPRILERNRDEMGGQ